MKRTITAAVLAVLALLGLGVSPAHAYGQKTSDQTQMIWVENRMGSLGNYYSMSDAVSQWNSRSKAWFGYGNCRDHPGDPCYILFVTRRYEQSRSPLATTMRDIGGVANGTITFYLYDDQVATTTAQVLKRRFITLHEFGHAAGCPGHLTPTTVMMTNYSASQPPTLTTRDVNYVNAYWR